MQLFVVQVTVIWDNGYHFVQFCLTVMYIYLFHLSLVCATYVFCFVCFVLAYVVYLILYIHLASEK